MRDSKCDYPAACNAMETLLIHKRHVTETDVFSKICSVLKDEGVTINSGPKLRQLLQFGPPLAKSMRIEYSALECTIEAVESVEEAINHINTYGSSHTDSIVTEDGMQFACKWPIRLTDTVVRHNREEILVWRRQRLRIPQLFDAFRRRLSIWARYTYTVSATQLILVVIMRLPGAEVGISTSRIHSRGPVGVEGLLSTKWIVEGKGHTVKDFADGTCAYKHINMPVIE